MKRYFDTLFIGLGLFFLGFGSYLVWERESPRHLVFASESSVATPIAISIESLALNLPIYPSSINEGKWETTKDGVSYLATSPLPGELGNSIIYGNWGNLLGSLELINPGGKINIKMSSGKTLSYIVHFVTVVTPDETHIYGNTPDYRLTLYTCTGFLDSKRLVVTAILERSN
jgi:LPXTG-site transpeptidase (sortase) family protein